ncbi:MAG: hypothetical protein WA951_12805 [Leeuwenhoekiella sp.]
MSFKIFMNCDKAAHICDKTQYDESSFLEKLRLRMHILFCQSCKSHTEKNVKLTQMLRKANFQSMPEDQKQQLQRLIDSEYAK